MATIQQNSKWHDLRTVKKGDYGEKLVADYFESRGWVIYNPRTDKAHGFDGYLYKDGKQIALEVKTKPRCLKYPETGFDEYAFQRYKKLSEEKNMPVVIAFVDELEKQIYGNWLSELNKPLKTENPNEQDYPKVVGHTGGNKLTRYFPLKFMRLFRNLTDDEVDILKSFNRR